MAPDAASDTDPSREIPVELPAKRLQFVANWFGLPRSVTVEFDHENIPMEELQAGVDKLGKLVSSTDLATRVDEANLGGLGRYVAKLLNKYMNGRVATVVVTFTPEHYAVNAKDFAKQVSGTA